VRRRRRAWLIHTLVAVVELICCSVLFDAGTGKSGFKAD